MDVQMIIRIFVIACIVTIALPASVLAVTFSEDQISTLSGNPALANFEDTDNSISIPGTSIVEMTGINAVNFPNVIAYVTVNTTKGRAGELKKDDFQIYENGDLMEITSVSFPDSSTKTKLDLAILFDDTGSMSEEIADLKDKVMELTDNIASANIDCRYSLISFHDEVSMQQQWTSDPTVIKNAVDGLNADGGDDAPEVDLDAIETALGLGFRSDAQHMILDITDSSTHFRDDGTSFSKYTIPETASHLLSNGTSYILVGPATTSGSFNVHSDKKELVKALGGSGLFIDIHSNDFTEILDKIQSIITQTYTIGYYTPNLYGDERKSTVLVQVGNDADSGQYTAIMREGSPTAQAQDLSPLTEDQGKDKLSGTEDSISTLGSSIVDITGINGVNFPGILTYVTVNTTPGRTGALKKEDFQIYEDGDLMNITSFSFTDSGTPSKLDLAILFDDTGSMRDEINDMKEKVNELTGKIASAGIDCRYALVSFKDKVTLQQEWTTDEVTIKSAVDGLNASEGFDAPEVDLDAIETVLGMGFRPDAQHMVIDITDDLTHYRNDGTRYSNYTITETAGHLLNNGTSYILVGPTTVSGEFNSENDKRELVKALGGSGLFIDIHKDDFSVILDNIQGVITNTYTLGYTTPDGNGDGEKRTVLVEVGTNSDSGQYIASVSEI